MIAQRANSVKRYYRNRTIMKKWKAISPFALVAIALSLLIHTGAGASEPMLARLSFWVPPERMAEFEVAYEKQVLPLLREQGAVESSQRGRATSDSVFSRLLEFPSLAEFEGLTGQTESQMPAVLKQLGTTFGTTDEYGLIRSSFNPYDRPVGPGHTVAAGPGRGHWRTYDMSDGLPNVGILSILQDRDGNLWFGTEGGGTCRFDGHVFQTLTTEDGLADGRVRSIIQDRSGAIWFAPGYMFGSKRSPETGGVTRLTGNQFQRFTTEDGLADSRVKLIREDRQGNLWFITRNGLTRFDGQQFHTFTAENGLAGAGEIIGSFQDRQGNLWFITYGHGAIRYDGRQDAGQRFTSFTSDHGLAGNFVPSFLEDREGNLWFGTNAGVSCYSGQGITTFTTRDGLPGNEIMHLLQDRQGRIWYTTRLAQVGYYDGESFTNFSSRDGLVGRGMLEDQEGHLWLTEGSHMYTSDGLDRYDGKRVTTFAVEDGLPSNRVNSLLESRDGALWFGTAGGLCRYDGSNFHALPLPQWLQRSEPGVLAYLEDHKGNIWFASLPGMVRFDGQDFDVLTAADGLPAEDTWSLLEDRHGNLWFATYGGGLCRYDGQTFHTFTVDDGLPGNVIRSIIQDRDGSFWIGCSGGLTHFRPPPPSPPPVYIDAIVADRRYEPTSSVELPSSAGMVAFEFHGLSLKTRPGAMVYRYRLRGHDPDWRVTRDRRVEYPDLPRGEYTFEVVAVDRDLAYSPEPAMVELRVHLPYERLAWLAALALALLGIAWQTTRVIRRDRRARSGHRHHLHHEDRGL